MTRLVAEHRRADQLHAGEWILMFGTVSEVVAVGDHPGFPCARLLTLRPPDHEAVTTLVPRDVQPIVLSTPRQSTRHAR